MSIDNASIAEELNPPTDDSQKSLDPVNKTNDYLRTPAESMRAVYYDDYGDTEVLKVGTVKTPHPKKDQVQIRVMATSVNPIDWRLRQGAMRHVMRGHFPRIPGYDVSGYVIEGGDSIGLQRGDRVLAFLDSMYGGAYAEYAVCGLDAVTKIPEALSFEEAAGIPLAGSTALQSLRDHGQINPLCRVLINGGSGGVGGFAVQIAKHDGAHVTAVSKGENESYVRALGCHDFIDYESQDFTKLGKVWDLIFDAAGKSSYLEARKVLSKHGRFVSTEPSLKGAALSILTLASPRRCRVMLAKPKRTDLAELVSLYEKGALKVMVDDVLPISDAVQAHYLSEHGQVRGKLVLRL